MACNDIKFWSPSGVPHGSTYVLTVVGPAGAFSAVAEYDDPGTGPIVAWGAGKIVGKTKSQLLSLVGDHFVHITVGTLVPGSAVQVKAEVRRMGGTVDVYCRTVNTSVPSEKITHQIGVI